MGCSFPGWLVQQQQQLLPLVVCIFRFCSMFSSQIDSFIQYNMLVTSAAVCIIRVASYMLKLEFLPFVSKSHYSIGAPFPR